MGKTHTILLIDSSAETYHQSLVAALRECQVIIEKNTQKACEFFFHNDVDLVLLDHTPDAPCMDLLQVLKFVAPSLPVIIMTAYGSEELAVSVFRNGASDYLKKPIHEHELRDSIQTVLGIRERSFNRAQTGIHKAIQYINTNYCLPLKLAHVARQTGMSVSCLERAFKKTLSVTYSVYLNKVRIARAMQMLEEGVGYSISEIAFACGFNNQYHFARMFKKMTQACPREFKKKAMVENKSSL
ncbi:MAG: response regulator transcription factor [Deltaproteobacteria bacterium]|nr:response regulator transcription factor [Deltaproteobacteria bacterium]